MNKIYKILLPAVCVFSMSASAISYKDSSESFSGISDRYKIDFSSAAPEDLIKPSVLEYGYGEWEEYGEPFNCEFIPAANTVLKGEEFTQTQACLQQQMRKKYTYEYGKLTKTEDEFRYGDAERDITAIGTLTFSFITEYSEWVNTRWTCTYGPLAQNVWYNFEFTQTHNCTQFRERTKSTYKVNDVTKERQLTSQEKELGSYPYTKKIKVLGTHPIVWRYLGVYENLPSATYVNKKSSVLQLIKDINIPLKPVQLGSGCSNYGELAGTMSHHRDELWKLVKYKCF